MTRRGRDLCRRCRRPLASPGTEACLHVRVNPPEYGQALRGLIALEHGARLGRSDDERT